MEFDYDQEIDNEMTPANESCPSCGALFFIEGPTNFCGDPEGCGMVDNFENQNNDACDEEDYEDDLEEVNF